MLCSHSSELAIRAALFLALQPPGKLSPVHEVARDTGLPSSYLAKIIQRLTSAGLVRGFRGPGGGVELGRAPGAISLWSIVRAMEGPVQQEWCALGLNGCSEESPCPVHCRWKPMRDKMHSLLKETTLAFLISRSREKIQWGDKSWVPLGGKAAASRQAKSEKRKAS